MHYSLQCQKPHNKAKLLSLQMMMDIYEDKM